MTIGKNFINGEWVDGANAVPDVNPSNLDDVVAEFTQVSAEQTQSAVAAAKQAFRKWSQGSIQQRFEILDGIGNEILARREELGTLLSREEGKTRPEGIGEAARAGNIFKFFAGEVLRLSGEVLPSVRPGLEVEITREPVGVIGLITPWNFPLAIPAWKIALRRHGNCVPQAGGERSLLVLGLAEILSRSGLPPGVFNLTTGRGSVVGNTLVTSPDVDAISFTGSVPVGRTIARQAMDTMKKVQLEMGGKNPQVVLDDANLDIAVNGAVQSAFFSTGQRCTASSRLIVTEGIHDRFVQAMIERMRTLKIDDALKAGTDIGPVVDKAQLEQDLSYVEIGQSEGAKLVQGGERVKRATDGFYMTPALFTESTQAMRINREEIFGPVASVIRVRDYDEALAVANDTPFGLVAGICTDSLKVATHFKRNAQAGMVMVNLPTAGVDYHVPFGGRKGSSYGPREQGRYAREFYTVVKTTYTNPG